MSVAKNIKRIMQEKGYKNSRIARKLGLTSPVFSNMLNGRRLILADDLVPISKALEVEVNDLLNENGYYVNDEDVFYLNPRTVREKNNPKKNPD